MAAVALLLAAVMLSGCVDKPQEGGTLPPLASPSATPSASPSAKPAGTDQEQVIALARDYLAESTKAMNTGDTRRLRSLATADCPCNRFPQHYEQVWKTGRVTAPGYYQIHAVLPPVLLSRTTASATVVVTVGREIVYGADGAVLHDYPPTTKTDGLLMDFTKVTGGWKVSDVTLRK